MKKFYSEIYDKLNSGQDAVLVILAKCFGTTPRKAGTKMAVFSDGTLTGTVGGGNTEFVSINKANEILKTKISCLEDIDIIESGNGSVKVLFKYIGANDENCRAFMDIVNALDENDEKWVQIDLENNVKISTKRFGGGADFDTDRNLYTEPVSKSGTVYIFGGGHVAQKLAKLLPSLNFRTVLYEDRQMFADRKFFPDVDEIIFAPYEDITEKIDITEKDYTVIVTRGHLYDYECLKTSLESKACYVGIMGSKDKLRTAYTKLKEDGFDEKEFGRIYSPIGIEIGSETPMEVAVSIAAQLIKIRSDRRE